MTSAALPPEMTAALRAQRARLDGSPPAAASASAAEALTELFDLPEHGLSIRGASIYGSGSSASAEIRISNGETMTFDSLRDAASPTILAAELVACTGSIPKKLGRGEALKTVALLRQLAQHELTLTDNEIAFDWGVQYLQGADVLDIDMNDQGERWAAFEHIARADPWSKSRAEGISLAAAGVLLRHTDGTRFVRCGWFHTHVRTIESSVSQHQVGMRMARVGWGRRGASGRIKATAPGRDATLAWSFFVVPEGWENGR